MDLIFDTHALFWLSASHPKLSDRVVSVLADPKTRTFVSAVTAWEYGDLRVRGRLPGGVRIEEMQDEIGFEMLDFPAAAWTQSERLPLIHRDPIDRMLVAHAIATGLILVTADTKMQRYPVSTFW